MTCSKFNKFCKLLKKLDVMNNLKDFVLKFQTYPSLNVTVFDRDNSSTDISITTLDLYFAAGHIIGENFGSVSGQKI